MAQSTAKISAPVQKLKYDPWGRKFLIKPPDDRNKDWSDDEGDYLVKPRKVLKQKAKDDEKAEANASKVSLDDGRLPQIQIKSNRFTGTPVLDRTKDISTYNKFARGARLPPFDKTEMERRSTAGCSSRHADERKLFFVVIISSL